MLSTKTPTIPIPPRLQPLVRITADCTATLFKDVHLPPRLRQRIQAGQTPLQLLDLLLIDDQLTSATTVLAHALPGREAILWCCLSIEELEGEIMHHPDRDYFENCIRWVMQPIEPLRQLVGAIGEPTTSSAVAVVSKAIRQCGARIEAEHEHKPSEGRRNPLPILVGKALRDTTHAAPSTQIVPRQRRAIAIGIGVARGLYRFAK
jgi:hypothetical protein